MKTVGKLFLGFLAFSFAMMVLMAMLQVAVFMAVAGVSFLVASLVHAKGQREKMAWLERQRMWELQAGGRE